MEKKRLKQGSRLPIDERVYETEENAGSGRFYHV
jgi:hypothetical protein